MSSIPETPIDALNQSDSVDQKQQQQPQDQNAAAAAAEGTVEEMTKALQVSEPSSASSSHPTNNDGGNDDQKDGSHATEQQEEGSVPRTTVPTIEEPKADEPALSIVTTQSEVPAQQQQPGLQQQQLSPAPVVPKSPASSRYTIDDDDDSYYEDGFEGGQLTILQGPGHQAAPAPKEAPAFDIRAELDFVKARLETIPKDVSDQKVNEERVALQELQKSTEIYIASQDALAEKQQQLANVQDNDGVRAVLQSQVDQLSQETKAKERQWSATKEVYHREFGELMDSPKKLSSVRAKTEIDIQQLQEQIAHLQRQLDTVAARRRQMMADAEEHRRRFAEAGLDD
ncbi:hypothetical protein BGW41_007936 [Actinomortierella wolfii]|nr:hypothetical protein BGW41_007936 [Actinomortierella wolfii]